MTWAEIECQIKGFEMIHHQNAVNKYNKHHDVIWYEITTLKKEKTYTVLHKVSTSAAHVNRKSERTYCTHLCVISYLSTGTASLYCISGNSWSSEWGQTHHSPADRTLPVSLIQAPKCTELAAIRHLGKYQQKLGFNKDRIGHDETWCDTHTHMLHVHQMSLLMASCGQQTLSLLKASVQRKSGFMKDCDCAWT